MRRKICIVSSQHISANPRVWKEAASLSAINYDVSIVTVNNSVVHRDRDKAFLERLPGVKYIIAASIIYPELAPVKRLRYKLKGLLGRLLKKAGIDNTYLLSRAVGETYKTAAELDADLYICHTEPGLIVGKKLIENGKTVAFDMEDWYSRDYLVPDRPVSLLKNLEGFALRNGVYITCPSAAMAEAMQQSYQAAKRPAVIYNSFPDEGYCDGGINKVPQLVWFSQTIGAGLGLEKIFTALAELDVPVSLSLIGAVSASYRKTLEETFPFSKGHQLHIIEPVPHHELHALLCSFDIGLALEDKYPDSRNKTVTNKILQYLQAGIKVVATNTDGQTEVAKLLPGAVSLVDVDNISDWHQVIQQAISSAVDKKNITEKFNEVFSWSTQEKKLQDLVVNVF